MEEVICVDQLSARLLIREAPPHRSVAFDPLGRATESFNALIMGFGRIGQQVLRELVMNGQFHGSQMSVTVLDSQIQSDQEEFCARYAGMISEYDIRFLCADSHSEDYWHLLDQCVEKSNYVVVCPDSAGLNEQTVRDLQRCSRRLSERRRARMTLSVCDRQYVTTAPIDSWFGHCRRVACQQDLTDQRQLDAMAMVVNLSYAELSNEEHTAVALWEQADQFSRKSCRASADFIPALLHMAGLDSNAQGINTGLLQQLLRGELLEHLAMTEHLRWNAFHYAMGYTAMSLAEVSERGKRGLAPFQKDVACLRHACLVAWDELDQLSTLLSQLTGESVDYKEMDRANVRNIPRVLALAKSRSAIGRT